MSELVSMQKVGRYSLFSLGTVNGSPKPQRNFRVTGLSLRRCAHLPAAAVGLVSSLIDARPAVSARRDYVTDI